MPPTSKAPAKMLLSLEEVEEKLTAQTGWGRMWEEQVDGAGGNDEDRLQEMEDDDDVEKQNTTRIGR